MRTPVSPEHESTQARAAEAGTHPTAACHAGSRKSRMTAPEPASNGIPLYADEAKQPSETKAADEEPIEFNSQRDNMYSTKVTLGGDRLRRYFPDVTMTPMANCRKHLFCAGGTPPA